MNDVPMNPDNAPLTTCLIHGSAWCTCRREVSLPSNEVRNPEAPPTGPVLSAEDEVLLLERAACTSYGAMKDAQAWNASHEALRATLAHARQRISDLEDNAARLEGRMGVAINRIRVLEAEQDVLLEGLSSCVRQLENYNQEPVEAYKQAVVAAQALLGKGDAKS